MKKLINLSLVFTAMLLFTVGCKKKGEDPKPSPIADFSFSTPGNAPSAITFTNLSQHSDSYLWDFGDNSTSTENQPVHTFNSDGNFQIKLTAINANGTNSITKQISISKSPLANFTYSTPGYAPTTITFTNTSQNSDTYLWDFGDNNTSTDKNPQHLYTTAFTYNVKLKASNAFGSNTYSTFITIQPKPIVYTNCKIMSISINSIPALDGNGAGWDATTAPDLFVKMLAGSTELLNTTSARYNDNITYPVGWNITTPIIISNLSIQHKIEVWDYDWPDADDLISTLAFNPGGYPSWPSTITLVNGNTSVTMGVQWY